MEDCKACNEGIESVLKQQEDAMKKHGWYAHYIIDEKEHPKFGITFANFHTHGVQESFGHPDFQIVIPLPLATAHAIITKLVDHVKNGGKFPDGEVVYEIVKNYPVKMFAVSESGRNVLRIILPDDDGKVENKVMSKPFKYQYDI